MPIFAGDTAGTETEMPRTRGHLHLRSLATITRFQAGNIKSPDQNERLLQEPSKHQALDRMDSR